MEKEIERRIPPTEATAFPWWAIICPDRLSGYTKLVQRVSSITSAVIGPFFSRESATACLEDYRSRYGTNAVVCCMSGYESPDWRAFCTEPAATIEPPTLPDTALLPSVTRIADMVEQRVPGGRLMYCVLHTAGPQGMWADEAADRACLPLGMIGSFIAAVREVAKQHGASRDAFIIRKQEGRLVRLIIPKQEKE